MKKLFLCVIGALSVFASGYLAFSEQGGEVAYGALIAVAVTCVVLASTTQAPARTSSLEYIRLLDSAIRGLTLFDYMLLGMSALLLGTLAVALPGVFIFVMAVLMSGALVGLLFWMLAKHTG